MDTNRFFILDFNNFTYGVKIYSIDKNNLKQEFSKFENFKMGEQPQEGLARILETYNVKEFLFKPNKQNNYSKFENYLIEKGFKKYEIKKGI